MAWAETLQDASFRGVPFEVASTSDSRARQQAVYQAPYTPLFQVDDLGADPRRVSLRAYVLGDDYETGRDALLIALDAPGPGPLVHPVFGQVQASVLSWSMDHDTDLVNGCALSIDLLMLDSASDGQPVPVFVPVSLPTPTADVAVMAGPVAALAQYQAQLGISNALGRLSEFVGMVRAGLRTAQALLDWSEDLADSVLSPPGWVGGLLGQVEHLATDLLTLPGSVQLVQWRGLLKRLRNLGHVWDDRHPEPLQRMARALPVAGALAAVQVLVQAEQQAAVLTPPELETIRDDVRGLVNAAIAAERQAAAAVVSARLPVPLDAVRQVQVLKSAAQQVQQTVGALLERRPSLVVHTVALPCTWRLLAHRLYGDHSRAAELARLNPGVVNPALLMPGQVVRCFADG